MKKIILSLSVLYSINTLAQVAHDISFGDNGFVYIEAPQSGSAKMRIHLQADGKILLSGSRINGNNLREDYVTRFFANGTIDTTFGINGYYIFTDTIDDLNAAQLFLLSDGSIICYSDAMGSSIIKLHADGTVDSNFANLGGLNIFDGHEVAFIDSAEYIYFLRHLPPTASFALQRISSVTGLLDISFGVGPDHCVVLTPVGDDGPGDVLPDGKYLLYSNSIGFESFNCSLKRFLPDGNPDAGFGINGIAKLYGTPEYPMSASVPTYDSMAYSIDGSVFITTCNSNYIPVVRKIDTNGQLVTSFGTDGLLILPPDYYIISTYVHNESLYLIGRHRLNNPESNMVVAKYNLNGTPDTNFAPNGLYEEISNPYFEGGESMVFTADGGFIVTGETIEGSVRKAYLAKYYGETLTVLNPSKINLKYKNPITDYLEISGDLDIVEIHLYGIDGKPLKYTSGARLDTFDLPAGLYLAKIKTEDNELQTLKVLKK